MCHVTRSERCHDDVAKLTLYLSLQLKLTVALADLGFLEGVTLETRTSEASEH